MCFGLCDLWAPKSNLMSSSLSPSLCQIWRNSLKTLLRYHIRHNETDGWKTWDHSASDRLSNLTDWQTANLKAWIIITEQIRDCLYLHTEGLIEHKVCLRECVFVCVWGRESLHTYSFQLTHLWGMCLHCVRWLNAEQTRRPKAKQPGLGRLRCSVISVFGAAPQGSAGKGSVKSLNNTHPHTVQLRVSWAVTQDGMLGVVGGFLTFRCRQEEEDGQGEQSVTETPSSHEYQACYQETIQPRTGRRNRATRLKASPHDLTGNEL